MRDITIDFSDVRNKLDIMRIVLSPRQMDLMLERALRRTSSHVKTILKRDLPKQYNRIQILHNLILRMSRI